MSWNTIEADTNLVEHGCPERTGEASPRPNTDFEPLVLDGALGKYIFTLMTKLEADEERFWPVPGDGDFPRSKMKHGEDSAFNVARRGAGGTRMAQVTRAFPSQSQSSQLISKEVGTRMVSSSLVMGSPTRMVAILTWFLGGPLSRRGCVAYTRCVG